jgi:hypothetical protein
MTVIGIGLWFYLLSFYRSTRRLENVWPSDAQKQSRHCPHVSFTLIHRDSSCGETFVAPLHIVSYLLLFPYAPSVALFDLILHPHQNKEPFHSYSKHDY